MVHQTYIIYSSNRKRYYIGSTSVGVKKRLERHNLGGTKSTKSGVPWQVRYIKSFEVKTDAMRWEKHIKSQKSVPYIESLIDSEENEWSDMNK